MLKQIKLTDIGPAQSMDVSFAPRLNILTGDNGLGKTFILDMAWWVLTRTWAGLPAWPEPSDDSHPIIEFRVAQDNQQTISTSVPYSYDLQDWKSVDEDPSDKLVIYARSDGGVSVWDPARSIKNNSKPIKTPSGFFNFSADQVWNGLESGKTILCNGLIRDWDIWRYQKEETFNIFAAVLAVLSPEPGEVMRPGKSIRLKIDDARSIPTLALPYGKVPVTHLSAGMRRVIAFAYLLVWAWDEHQESLKLTKRKSANRLIVLFDEVEAHLHPRWQRVFLPAVFNVVNILQQDIGIQIVASTHAPLVLASIESLFDEARDQTVHVAMDKCGVKTYPVPWAKQGDAVNWLVSDIFGLKQARSREAEQAIEAAEAFMRGDWNSLPPQLNDQQAIHDELLGVLAGHDPFWPRWIVKTEGAIR